MTGKPTAADIIAARQKAAQQLLADASAAKAAAQSEREKAKAENEKLAEHRSEALKAVEAEAATETNRAQMGRAWELWKAEALSR